MIDGMQQHLQIIPIPAFKDNYIWLIHNGSQAIIVDPGDAEPVVETLKRLELSLQTILVTHHHHDHIGGVAMLIEAYPDAKVYAPKLEQYDFNHIPIGEPDVIELTGFNLKLAVINLPGHTLGHVGYYIEHHAKNYAYENHGDSYGKNLLFCGDTLFGAGCGRLFEGTPAQMMASLQKLAALPLDTQVYCTHEYTLHNINFALSLEPNNQALIERHLETLRLRNLQQPSLPSSIGLELATNPFLRCHSQEIQSSIQLTNAAYLQIFSTIRELRNHY
ncbi:MAG: hydroxyacylglutathione hydrolase [Methylotenera sp.]